MSTAQIIQTKVSKLSAEEQAKVLDYLEWLEATRPVSDEAWGEVGAKLAADILDKEDFSDWDKKIK